MACQIQNPDWTAARSFDTAALVEVDGEFFLQISPNDGEHEDPKIQEGVPLAIDLPAGEPGTIRHANADFGARCKLLETRTFALDPNHEAGGFRFRSNGGGLGISDIRDSGFRVIYLDLSGFPLVLEKVGGTVLLRFNSDISHYYISPKFSPPENEG